MYISVQAVLTTMPWFRTHNIWPSSSDTPQQIHPGCMEGGRTATPAVVALNIHSWQYLLHGRASSSPHILTCHKTWLNSSVMLDQLARTTWTRTTIPTSSCWTTRTGPCTWATPWRWRSSSWWRWRATTVSVMSSNTMFSIHSQEWIHHWTS